MDWDFVTQPAQKPTVEEWKIDNRYPRQES